MGRWKHLLLTLGMIILAFYYLGRLFGHVSTVEFISNVFLLGFLIKITESNIRSYLIEDKWTFPLMGLGILVNILIAVGLQENILQRILSSVGGLVLAGGCLYILATLAEHIIKKECVGGGDIKLTAAVGAFVGTYVIWIIPVRIIVLIISFLIYGLIALLKKKKMAQSMPTVFIHFVSLIILLSIQNKLLDPLIIILGLLVLFMGSYCLVDNQSDEKTA